MNIALLGFGTVGSHFYRMASERDDVNIAAVLSRRPRPELSCAVTADFDELVRNRSIDVVVEVMGGVEPAYSYISAAMRAGKHVVTANKQLMCARYDELLALARECGVRLRCTAAAGGGVPWLSSLSRMEKMDTIDAVEGILNGTTNFMLSAMTADGTDYGETLCQAQTLGYAEADPTADVEGLDARRKLVLSANLAFGVSLREADIPCAGISHITAADINWARERGCTFKLIARAERPRGDPDLRAERASDAVAAFVCPTLFSAAAPEAHTNGTDNLVSLYARRVGKQSFSGAGAGGFPTASGVLADCLAVASGGSYYTDRAVPCTVDNGAAVSRWLFRRGGTYESAECPAKEAFARYESYLTDDPLALLARVASDTEKEG